MQLSFKKRHSGRQHAHPRNAAELHEGERAILEGIDLPESVAHRLMELGFIPGGEIAAGRFAPGGDPRIFCVDGSEIALRCEIARHLHLRSVK